MARSHSDTPSDGTAITLSWERVHELTTEHGTRIVVDLRRGRLAWMRLSAPHADGVVNADPRRSVATAPRDLAGGVDR